MDEWVTRAWCAKEAAGKAAGTGLPNGPKSYEIRRIDALTGSIAVFPCVAGIEGIDPDTEFSVKTMCDGDFVIAIATNAECRLQQGDATAYIRHS